jgi:hypothetical protein
VDGPSGLVFRHRDVERPRVNGLRDGKLLGNCSFVAQKLPIPQPIRATAQIHGPGAEALEHFRFARCLGLDLLGARGNVIAGDHLAVALSRTDHGIDAGVAIDNNL